MSNLSGTPNPDIKILFAVSDGKVEIAYKTFSKFKTLNIMCEDLEISMDDLATFPKIPTQYDANNIPIHISTVELQNFVNLFELYNKNENANGNAEVEAELFEAISRLNINFNEIKKYLILINYLDNQSFLNSLCRYSAKLVRDTNANLC